MQLLALHPAGFALLAGAVWLAGLAAPGLGSKTTGGAPLAHWDAAASNRFWRQNPALGWVAYDGPPLAIDDSPGISIAFEPHPGHSAVLIVKWRNTDDGTWAGGLTGPRPLSHPWIYLELSELPQWKGRVSDLVIGTQAGVPLAIRSVTLESRGPLAEWSRAWRGFLVPDLLDQPSINFLKGPQVGQVAWTLPIALALTVYLLLKLVEAVVRRRRLDWRNLIRLTLAAWILLDLRFTLDLAADARVDAARFPSLAVADGVAAGDDAAYASLVKAVNAYVPAHAKIAFITDDPTYMNKAQYVFFPRVVVNSPGHGGDSHPEYEIVFRKGVVRFDAGTGMLALAGADVPVRLLVRVGNEAFVFAVRSPVSAGVE